MCQRSILQSGTHSTPKPRSTETSLRITMSAEYGSSLGKRRRDTSSLTVSSSKDICQSFRKMREAGNLFGERFPAGKSIPVSSSEFKETLHWNGMKEVELQEVQAGTSRVALDFIYGYEIAVEDTQQGIHLLECAQSLARYLFWICCKRMYCSARKLRVSVCVQIR